MMGMSLHHTAAWDSWRFSNFLMFLCPKRVLTILECCLDLLVPKRLSSHSQNLIWWVLLSVVAEIDPILTVEQYIGFDIPKDTYFLRLNLNVAYLSRLPKNRPLN